jgi:hypothetical protein
VDPDLGRIIDDAGIKDASADPATLAWVLSQLKIGPAARLPYDVDPIELDTFRADLVGRLQDLSFERARGHDG